MSSLALDRLAVLAGRSWSVRHLPHRRERPVVRIVTTDGAEPSLDMVVRHAGAARGTHLNGEWAATNAAAGAGVGPAVLECRPEDGLLAVQYVEGRVPSPAELAEPARIGRVAEALRHLHARVPSFDDDLDLVAEARSYPALAEDPLLARIEAALALQPERRVPCHNDVVAGNVIDDGERVWLIDFEYAANNEPSADLAGLAVGADLDAARIRLLASAYDGDASPSRVARIMLWRVVHLLLWSEWALALGHDDWAARLTARRDAALADTDLPLLLDLVVQPTSGP